MTLSSLASRSCRITPVLHSAYRLQSLLARESFVKVDECEPITNIIGLHLLHSLLATVLSNIKGLNIRLDTLLACQFQHFQYFRSRSNVACSDLCSVGSKILCFHWGQWLIRKPDIMEGSIDSQGRHIFCKVEGMCHVGSVQDEIEGKCPGFGPVFVFGTNELFSAKSECVFLFAGAM